MKILAHRGLWSDKTDANTLPALFNALDKGFGLETDVRDLNGQLVVSHDIPSTDCFIPLENLLRYYADGKFSSTLGLNIKSDGLQEKLFFQLKDYGVVNYFVFDMSIPDTLGYLKMGMKTFIRRSELENHPEATSRAEGVWLDELTSPWLDAKAILAESRTTNSLCIVSAELHGREHELQWAQISRALDLNCPTEKLLICTDFACEAERFLK